MIRFIGLFLLMLIFISCNGKKEEVINLSERIPKSERDYDSNDTLDTVDLLKKDLISFQMLDPNIQSVKKREETHKMAEANRAFSHFRW